MSERTINQNDPFSLILTPDYQQQTMNATQDIVWEVQLDGGESGGLSIYSTLALSALSLRIIPIFSNSSETRIKLKQFSSPITIIKNSTNFAKFCIEPFDGIIALIDFWIINSNLIIGRTTINNSSPEQFSGAIAWAIQYNPLVGGSAVSHSTRQNNPFLHGKTQDKHIVFLSSGAPSIGKIGQMSLENQFKFLPGAQQVFNWSFCINENLDNAFEDANIGLNFNLDAEIARAEITSQRDLIEFETGNQDWDLILSASQIAAKQLILKKSGNEHAFRFVKSRNPEQKISLISNDENTKNFDELNLFDLWYFFQILPNSSDLVLKRTLEILNDFFGESPQRINAKQNLLFQKSLPFPILAEILWRISSFGTNDFDVEEIFKKLILYLKAWVKDSFEENTEIIPTWSSPMQCLYDYLPIHDRWHFSSEGLDTKWIRSPMLLSLLYNEFSQAFQIAKLLNQNNEMDWLESIRNQIHLSLSKCWHPKRNFYSYQDLISHTSYTGSIIKTLNGSGEFLIEKKLQREQRLTIKISNNQETTRRLRIVILGISEQKSIHEEINPRDIHWYGKIGFYTSKTIFQQLDAIEVINNPANETIVISTGDFSKRDLTLALPIWAGASDEKKTKKIMENTLISDFLQPFGLPYVPLSNQTTNAEIFNNVDLPLNCMVMHGLLQYGYTNEVRQIWTNNMLAVAKNLKLFRRFLKQYDASDGYGTGDYNIINGIPSITLFLNLIGIERWTKTEVVINRKSVFEEPMILRYRGNIIKTNSTGHEFLSPGGKKIITIGDGPHQIRIPD